LTVSNEVGLEFATKINITIFHSVILYHYHVPLFSLKLPQKIMKKVTDDKRTVKLYLKVRV
jgi:hypothetical protein